MSLAPRPLFNAMFRGRTDAIPVQLLRYGLVGALAFLVDFGALYALTEGAGLHYLLSAALSFGLGLLTNYGLSVAWVFPRRRLRNRWAEFAVFGLIGLAGLGFNESIMWLLTGGLGLHYLLSKVVATVGVYFWNFFARRRALFAGGR